MPSTIIDAGWSDVAEYYSFLRKLSLKQALYRFNGSAIEISSRID
jgi:hypothetical protein